jgi:hypothetical protein
MKPARRQKYYLIPYNLALLIRRERLFREFQIWLLLKHWSNGHLELTPRIIARLASSLRCSPRTIARTVARLRERNWLGYNPNTGVTYVRGMDSLRMVERIPGRLAVWFDIDRILHTEAFLAACTESFFVRGQKVKAWRKRAAGVHSKRGTIQPAPVPVFFPVALSLHFSFFGIAKSTAARERKLAEAAGFLLIRKAPPIPITTNNPAAFLRGFPELAGHIFERSGQWYIRPTDELKTNLLFKKRQRTKNRKT